MTSEDWQRRVWLARHPDAGLTHADANYHFTLLGAIANAYGDTSKFDLTSKVELVKYIAAFVNRRQPKINRARLRRGEVQAVPQGWVAFR